MRLANKEEEEEEDTSFKLSVACTKFFAASMFCSFLMIL